jgi:hypothetical protein
VLAALRDRMLALAAERASGAHPYLTTLEHTARARKALATVADRLREHLDAGADHVAGQPVATDLAGTLHELEQVAPLLLRT